MKHSPHLVEHGLQRQRHGGGRVGILAGGHVVHRLRGADVRPRLVERALLGDRWTVLAWPTNVSKTALATAMLTCRSNSVRTS